MIGEKNGTSVRWWCHLAGICLCVWLPVAASAQPLGGPRAETIAPRTVGILTGFRPALTVTHFDGAEFDAQFNWEVDMSVDLDMFDLGFLRGNLFANVETTVGDELRTVDPNQNSYVIDTSVSVRLPRGELVTTFHHVSRHLSDRANDNSVSWNMLGVGYGDRVSIGSVTLEGAVRALRNVKHTGVDYDGQYEGFLRIARSVNENVAVIGSVDGVVVPVDEQMFGRQTRRGGRIEAGVRFLTGVTQADIFVAWEQRIDAGLGVLSTTRWTQVGVRLTPRP
jgi:hypothetical protein